MWLVLVPCALYDFQRALSIISPLSHTLPRCQMSSKLNPTGEITSDISCCVLLERVWIDSADIVLRSYKKRDMPACPDTPWKARPHAPPWESGTQMFALWRPTASSQNWKEGFGFYRRCWTDTQQQTQRMERQFGTHKQRGLSLSARHTRRR